jgi:hypothetical protein
MNHFISFHVFSKKKKFFLKIFFCLILYIIFSKHNKKIIGVVGLINHNNIGNNLVKFSIYIKLKEFGLDPIIIGISSKTQSIYFLKKHVKLKEIKRTFSELKEKDYDILMVNSDQTWNGNKRNTSSLLNYGYLKFAENWTIPRFVYGASLGVNYWKFSKNFDLTARSLLKKFSGISVREKQAVKLVRKHLGINPEFVLDPTFLIDKRYYLDLIKDFKANIDYNKKYLCVYQLDRNSIIEKIIENAKKYLNYTIFRVNRYKEKYIENFIFYINISRAVITDSFHGTIFSIIFKKPFISYLNINRGEGRFISLIKTFKLKKRIIFSKNFKRVNINLLETPLNINQSLFNYLKINSINYLKKNLNITN